MNILFEELFHAWCHPYNSVLLPDYLKKDPVKGYGQYSFEEGFRLGFKLAVACLKPGDLCDLE